MTITRSFLLGLYFITRFYDNRHEFRSWSEPSAVPAPSAWHAPVISLPLVSGPGSDSSYAQAFGQWHTRAPLCLPRLRDRFPGETAAESSPRLGLSDAEAPMRKFAAGHGHNQ